MEQLLEDYKRRLATANAELDKFEYNCPDNAKYVRYQTKAECYRTFIAELERELIKN